MKKSILFLGLGGLLMAMLVFLLRLTRVGFLNDNLVLFIILGILSIIVLGFGVFSRGRK